MNRPKTFLASVLAVPLLSILLTLCTLGAKPAAAPADSTSSKSDVAVYFSPKGGCTEAIVRELDAAKRELKVQAYSFTSAPIAEAIAKAHERGVQVTVILDESQKTAKYSGATYLANHHVPTFIDAKHAIAHNKIMIIDGATVLTGSFNFTKAAEESNAENLLILRRPDLAKPYLENFQKHLEHSQVYQSIPK